MELLEVVLKCYALHGPTLEDDGTFWQRVSQTFTKNRQWGGQSKYSRILKICDWLQTRKNCKYLEGQDQNPLFGEKKPPKHKKVISPNYQQGEIQQIQK